MVIEVYWGQTDSGGQAPPTVTAAGVAVGADLALPVKGFSGLDESWEPEKLTNTAADDRRTIHETIVGWRGRFIVRYGAMETADRRRLARLVNLGVNVNLQPHRDADRSYLCRLAEVRGLDQSLNGRPVVYGPCSLTFETVRLHSGVPCRETATHFASADISYDTADEVFHFAAVGEEYEDSDLAGHFSAVD